MFRQSLCRARALRGRRLCTDGQKKAGSSLDPAIVQLIAKDPAAVVDALPEAAHRSLTDSVMERLAREVDPRALMKVTAL
jgi:hypothetical protein